MKEDRVTYSEIKRWVLDSYYMSCRDRGARKSGWTHELIVSDVYDSYADSFSLPVEQLMLEVVALVLVGGWYENQVLQRKGKVRSILSRYGLDELLRSLPENEAEDFVNDMRVLGLIPG